jgi:hypothetical protein
MLFGWDISTSVVGCTILNEKGKFVSTTYFEFTKMAKGAKTIFEKMRACEQWIYDTLSPYSSGSHEHFFEDRLGNFSKGFTRLQTLMMLAAFNAMFSYRVTQIHDSMLVENPECGEVLFSHLHPSTVKAVMKRDGLVIAKGLDKKQVTLHFVRRTNPDFPISYKSTGKVQDHCYDMADAYITARAGFLRKYLSCKDTKSSKRSGRHWGGNNRRRVMRSSSSAPRKIVFRIKRINRSCP